MNDASAGVRAGRAALPSVDRVLRGSGASTLIELHGRALVVDAVRSMLADYRSRRQGASVEAVLTDCGERLARMAQPSQRRVFNLTGTVLHTNLGRAPLPEEAGTEVQAKLQRHVETRHAGYWVDLNSGQVVNTPVALAYDLRDLADSNLCAVRRIKRTARVVAG